MQNNRCMREIDAKKLRSKIKNHTHIDSAKNDVRLEIVAGFGGGGGSVVACRLEKLGVGGC